MIRSSAVLRLHRTRKRLSVFGTADGLASMDNDLFELGKAVQKPAGGV